MTTYDAGDTARLTLTVDPVDATTTVNLTVTAPDGTETTPTVSSTGSGAYEALAVLDQVGTWLARWDVSGTGAGVEHVTLYAQTPAVLDEPAAFAAAEDLRRFLRLPTVDSEAATSLLQQVSDTIRAEVTQRIDHVTGDTITLGNGRGRPSWELFLPELPVLDVTSVTEQGLTLVNDQDYTWSPSGVLTRLGYYWPNKPRSVQVTYSHGYETVPGVMKTVCVQAAARAWVNPSQSTSVTVGGFSRSRNVGGQAPSGRIQLTEYERGLLDQLRP